MRKKSEKDADFSKSVERYRKQLIRFVNVRIKDSNEAEDLVQEILTKAFQNLSSYNSRYAFSTWLFKIAENCCIDHIRKETRKNISPDEAVAFEGDKHWTESGENGAEEDVLLPKARELMMSVPEKYREVFALRYIELMKYREIAKATNLPMGTVKTYLFRAKWALHTEKDNRQDA